MPNSEQQRPGPQHAREQQPHGGGLNQPEPRPPEPDIRHGAPADLNLASQAPSRDDGGLEAQIVLDQFSAHRAQLEDMRQAQHRWRDAFEHGPVLPPDAAGSDHSADETC